MDRTPEPVTGPDNDPGGDHYFTARPVSSAERRMLRVRLGGRALELETAGGVFSPGRLDLGTEVLLRTVPPPPDSGDLLDLGCGWGPLALSLAMASPHAAVWAVDVNERALDLVHRNAARLGLAGVTATTPESVPSDVRFAAIWSNPPIRVGKDALHRMLLAWLPRLAPGGSAYLVVQRNLGADSLHRWLDERETAGELGGGGIERVASAKGFRVLQVTSGS